LQAFFFKGLFTTQDVHVRRKIYSTGIEIGERFLPEFPQSVALHCWLGILWGYWGEVHSMTASARKGVPAKVRYYAEKTISLDSTFLDGGGFRMLGRLNFKVPKIPPFLNWPSKKKALQWLQKANAIGPDNWYNKLYLAEVLLNQNQIEPAVALLHEILQSSGIHHDVAIDAYIKKQARILLEKYQH
jgi:hypothetical protein